MPYLPSSPSSAGSTATCGNKNLVIIQGHAQAELAQTQLADGRVGERTEDSVSGIGTIGAIPTVDDQAAGIAERTRMLLVFEEGMR